MAAKPGKRYLEGADGKPFLIHGDTAWSLIAQLTREEVDRYLDDRRARGFNTILVSLIENHYSANPPANAYGERPFHDQRLVSLLPFGTVTDFTTPNEAYFAHADWVLRRAAEEGFLVLLTPAYLGCCSDGWYSEMVANGPSRLRQYGEYLGRRYRAFTNILWTHGGDTNRRKDLVQAIAEGIRQADPRALHTTHGEAETAALDYAQGEFLIQVNNVYTYGPVYGPALTQYARPERLPFFLIESAYEHEHEATERRLRTQAYHAVLCGACGQVFGNNPIWHFDSPNHWPAPVTWQEALGSRGAHSMTHLHDLLTSISWWLLEPDASNALLTEGLGVEGDRAVAARSADRSFALLYLPSSRGITVDLGELAGPRVAARWYDPANGRSSTLSGSPFPASGSRRFWPEPGTNSSGFDDWVLLLESHS
ncbi:MAG: glycoside hydrolase family 140 protein [Geminicoccaceae bacterium]